eukprot:IDg8814t1
MSGRPLYYTNAIINALFRGPSMRT